MKISRSRPPGYRLSPEKIVLRPKPHASPSHKTPVRIYVGTETAQARAERIFVWSIDLVRDPSRTYEIYLMKELTGFDRRRWLTGFTNYRFAIPHFAGGSGRAIFNDVDQIYLTDPGELFDLDLKDHGFLTIAKNDSSVMIMDCAKMHSIWTLERAQHERKNRLLKDALSIINLWGKLAPEWNARDEEYALGKSKVLHYTALHTQPWHPFPKQFVYQNSREGDVWTKLEEKANRAGYQLFSRTQPSAQFKELMTQATFRQAVFSADSSPIQGLPDPHDLDEHIATRGATTYLWCHVSQFENISQNNDQKVRGQNSLTITPYDLCHQTPDSLKAHTFDIVYSAGELHRLPDEDIPWILDEMFSLANSLVYVQIQTDEPEPSIPDRSHSRDMQRNFEWWVSHFHTTSKRYSKIHWKLVFRDRQAKGIDRQLVRCGGYWTDPLPKIWILSDAKVGHTTQSEALARLLGWPYEVKHLRFHGWNRFQKVLWGLLPPHTVGLDIARSSPLNPPWPDIVINAGWRSIPIARWIRKQNHGHTRIIQLGRKGGFSIDLFDVAITPTYYDFPSHPRRIETVTPLNQLTQRNIDEVSRQWPNLFQNTPSLRIVLILGGPTTVFSFPLDMATRLAHQVKDLAKQWGGTIFAITSPRTGEAIAQAFESVLQPEHSLHRWKAGHTNNPYLAYMAGADVILITGDSESMLAEAASLGKPMYIIPLPEKAQPWISRLNDWVIQRAHSRPLNKRGTVRPQQSMERLCARLLRGGLVQPRRDLTQLHELLIQGKIAHRLGEPLQKGKRPQLRETEAVAKRVKEVLGIFDHEHSSS